MGITINKNVNVSPEYKNMIKINLNFKQKYLKI